MKFTEDSVWGIVLILIGLSSLAFRPFDRLDKYISARGDKALTLSLIAVGLGAIALAIKGPPSAKAFVLFWIVAP